MIKHISNILEIVDKLSAIGYNINDSHTSALFLCSLPPSYNTLITALEARPEYELSLEFIRSKLTDESSCELEISEQTDKAEKAFKTHNKLTNSDNEKDNKCYSHCRRKNHSNKECSI